MRRSLGEPLPHQLADTRQAAPEAPELYSCETIVDYPVFRRAVHDFRVRSYLLLPRLPVPCGPSTCMPYPYRQRSP